MKRYDPAKMLPDERRQLLIAFTGDAPVKGAARESRETVSNFPTYEPSWRGSDMVPIPPCRERAHVRRR